jgi:IPT/TIG domain
MTESPRAWCVGVLGLHLLVTACGGSSTGPSPQPAGPVVSSISPASGPSIGGTSVTINGERFDATATVTIGGVQATSVAFVSAIRLTAVTGPRTTGPADVAVTVAGQRGVLSNGFTYTSSSVTNSAPVVTSLTAVGSRPNQPAGFADANEELKVTAVVIDAETPVSDLVFNWAADSGTFTGTGAAVTWKAPALFGGPTTAKLTLNVIERYTGTDASGNPVPSEHRVSAVTSVSVHDSVKENGDLATAFLDDFSNSAISPEAAVRHFYDGCSGKDAELQDIKDNRATYIIDSHTRGTPKTSIDFGGVCDFRARPADACISLSCEWHSTEKATGDEGVARGTCHLTSVYRDAKWQLCNSEFEGVTSFRTAFMR